MKLQFFTILLIMTVNSKGQDLSDDKGEKWRFRYAKMHAPFGAIYQNEFLFQLGQRFEIRKKVETINVSIYAQMQKRNVFYVFPTVLLNYYKPIKKYYGPTISLEYSYRKIESQVSNVLTPEIGIGLPNYISINYGYNIALDKLFPWTSRHRISFRIMLPG